MIRAAIGLALGSAAAVGLAPVASAQLYGGVGYTVFTAETGAGDATLGTVMGRLGYKTNPFLGFEGEMAIGVQDESFTVLGTPIEVGVDNELGGFAVGFLPIPLVGDVFGRVGYANISVEASGGGSNFTEDGSGLAYGGGLQFNVAFLKLRAEYTRYEPDDGELDSWGISGILQF
jgi:outer membrane immunogenic protein